MKILKLYVCEICGSEWRDEKSAANCEAYGVPLKSAPWELGGLVKLKNRSEGYTVAVVISAKILLFFGSSHMWHLGLDRAVRLDHQWEDSAVEVFDMYVLPESRTKLMERKDNFAS